MNKEDVEKILAPGVEVAPDGVWRSRVWKCSTCDTTYESDVPVEGGAVCEVR